MYSIVLRTKRKMEKTFGSRYVRRLYRAGLVKAVSRELTNYSSDVMGVQEIRWDQGGTDQTLQQGPVWYQHQAVPKCIPCPLWICNLRIQQTCWENNIYYSANFKATRKEIMCPYIKVNIRPGLSGTAPEIRHVPDYVCPIFCPLLFFRFYSVFLIIFFGMEIFVDLFGDFPDEEIENGAAHWGV